MRNIYLDFGKDLQRVAFLELDGIRYINTSCGCANDISYGNLSKDGRFNGVPLDAIKESFDLGFQNCREAVMAN